MRTSLVIVISLLLLLLLAGCGKFDPMSVAEADAYKACLDKNWVATFTATSSKREIVCKRK